MALYQISLKSTAKWLIKCLIIYKRSEADCFRAQSQAQSTNTNKETKWNIKTQTKTQWHEDSEKNTNKIRVIDKQYGLFSGTSLPLFQKDWERMYVPQVHVGWRTKRTQRTGLRGHWGQEASQAWKVPGLECVFLNMTMFIITSVPSLSSLSRPRGSLAWNVSS